MLSPLDLKERLLAHCAPMCWNSLLEQAPHHDEWLEDVYDLRRVCFRFARFLENERYLQTKDQ